MTIVCDHWIMSASRTCTANDCLRQLGEKNRTGLCVPHQARLRRTGSLGSKPIQVRDPEATSKQCGACGEEKPLDDFYRRSKSTDGYRSKCKQCVDAEANAWRAAHPDRAKSNYRRSGIRRKYGLAPEQFDALVAAQDGRCPVCTQPLGTSQCVDHDHSCCPGDHTCGLCVRGVLCRPCNVLLGMARDDAATLRAAIRYLEDRPPLTPAQREAARPPAAPRPAAPAPITDDAEEAS